MRRILFAVAVLSFVSFAPHRAEALTLPSAATLAESLAGQAEQVAYYCRRWCGRYGCSRRCWYAGPRYYRPYYRPYRYYRRW